MEVFLGLALAVGGYLIASVPAGLAFKLIGIDLGKEGSLNYGATNAAGVARLVYGDFVGRLCGFAVLLGDIVKCIVPLFLVWLFLVEWHTYAMGAAILLGNVFSCFGFRGKGVSVSVALFAIVVPELYLPLAVIWGATRFVSKKMSTSNLVVACFLVIFLWVLGSYPFWILGGDSLEVRGLGLFAWCLIIYAHARGDGWGNIGRLFRRQERDDPLFPI